MKKILFLILGILILGVIGYFIMQEKDAKITSFDECMLAGYDVMESYPRQCRVNEETFVEDIGNELEKQDLIFINNPRPNQIITSPIMITGEARGYWFFEGDFPIEVQDNDGNVIGTGIATAEESWMTDEFVPFSANVIFSTPDTDKGSIILKKDNASGLPEHDDSLIVPVFFEQGTMTLEVFFSNTVLDPGVTCNKVFSVDREVPYTVGTARAALLELLDGPTINEVTEGYSTGINQGVEIQSLSISNGTAYVDFNDTLQYQVGGSCRIGQIYAQLENTLKQFNSVDDVVISIDGETEDILQP